MKGNTPTPLGLGGREGGWQNYEEDVIHAVIDAGLGRALIELTGHWIINISNILIPFTNMHILAFASNFRSRPYIFFARMSAKSISISCTFFSS